MARIKLKKQYYEMPFGNKKGYKLRVSYGSAIDDEALIDLATKDSGLSREQILLVWSALKHQIIQLVTNGHTIELRDLGNFFFRLKAKMAENYDEAGAEQVHFKTIGFRPCKKLQKEMDRVKFTLLPYTPPEKNKFLAAEREAKEGE